MVTTLFVGAEIAQASDISFSGQFRPRWNFNEDATRGTNAYSNFDTRVRLNVDAKVNDKASVFLQFQSVGTWGNDTDNSGTRVATGGGGAQANDILDDVGFHQAHLTMTDLLDTGLTAKVGRQEIVLDGHRLFGHTGWTQGAQSSDAIVLVHAADNHSLIYAYVAGLQGEAENTNTDTNVHFHVVRANTQGIMGGDLTGMFVTAIDNANGGAGFEDMNTWYTVGARQAGKMAGLDYRVEYYHQFGDGGVEAAAAGYSDAYDNVTGSTAVASSNIDRNASMFGVRVGKTFKNVQWSPTVTLWFDSLSGTDDSDAADSDHGTFNTLMDTGHKFYGLMDQYLNSRNLGTAYYGLQDFAIKTKLNLSAQNTLKVDLHHFETQTDMNGGDSNDMRDDHSAINGQGLNSDLGQEVDVTFIHKYDSNTKIMAGYSHYFTTKTHSYLNGSGNTVGNGNQEGQDWMYVMLDLKF